MDPLNKTTTFGHDALNRLTSVAYSDGTTHGVTYAYDANNNRTSMVDGTGTTSYTYDEMNRQTLVTDGNSKTVGYRYDLDGNRAKIIYAGGSAANYGYDNTDRLQSLLDWGNRSTGYQYDPDGQLVTINNFNGTSASYSYDNARRLLDVWNQYGVNTISRHTYAVDAVGNRTAVTDVLPVLGSYNGPSLTTSYGYDSLYRLTSVITSGNPITYTYDPADNRLSLTKGLSATNYTYDRADRIQQAGTVAYTMNADGNLTGRGSDTFAYDEANRLKSATVASVASTYTYNGDGNRVSKTVGGATTNYTNDANRSLPVVLDDGTRKYVWGPDLAYSVDITGNVQVYYRDGLGSVRAMADANGQVIETYQTDEFGVPVATQGSIDQPFQYTGEQQDAEDGFYYLRARTYDPATGRFLSRDPSPGYRQRPASLNRFSYVLNDPATLTDPSGMCANREAKCLSFHACFDKCALEHFGLTELIGVIQGLPLIPTRAKFAGATSGTSIGSEVLRTLLPIRLPKGLPAPTFAKLASKTPALGAVLSRWYFPVSLAWTWWDLIQIDQCTIDCLSPCWSGGNS